MTDLRQEAGRVENLHRARRQAPKQITPQDDTDAKKKKISLVEAVFTIICFGVFFDLPQALLGIFMITGLLNIIYVPVGYLCVYIWLFSKGRRLMSAKNGNKLFYAFGMTGVAEIMTNGIFPGTSGFILATLLIERMEKVMKKPSMPTMGNT